MGYFWNHSMHVDHRQSLGTGQQYLFAADDGKGQLPGADQGDAVGLEAVVEFNGQPAAA